MSQPLSSFPWMLPWIHRIAGVESASAATSFAGVSGSLMRAIDARMAARPCAVTCSGSPTIAYRISRPCTDTAYVPDVTRPLAADTASTYMVDSAAVTSRSTPIANPRTSVGDGTDPMKLGSVVMGSQPAGAPDARAERIGREAASTAPADPWRNRLRLIGRRPFGRSSAIRFISTSYANDPEGSPELSRRVGRREEWDSNPRMSCPINGFQDRRLRPLGHPPERNLPAAMRRWRCSPLDARHYSHRSTCGSPCRPRVSFSSVT